MRWEPLKPTNNIPREQLTTDEVEPTIHSLCFVGATYLVGLSAHYAALYELRPDGARLVRSLEVDALVAALPTSHRQQFALLKSTGELTLHQLDGE